MTDIYIATEQRFKLYDGHFFAEATGGESFWCRYLDVFKHVKIIARVQTVTNLPGSAVRADSNNISIIPLPNYVGWRGVFSVPALLLHTKKVAFQRSAFILRVPGFVGMFMSFWLRLRQWPYGVEVVGDPYDSLSSQALGEKWADWLRLPAAYQLRKQCQNAVGSAYVTRETLQRRYPPGGNFTTHYSSLELDEHLAELGARYYQERRLNRKDNQSFRLIFVGSLSQRYKGLHVLIQAMKICQSQGWNLELIVLGDGIYRQEYEALAESMQLQNVLFQGYLKQGVAVFEQLSKAELFIMPSLMEGLPRAMIEAMACGLPCIGTRIGGIPELLADEDIVPPGDALALANKLIEVLSSPARMSEMSERNYQASMEYRSDNLRQRRIKFYQYILNATLEVQKR